MREPPADLSNATLGAALGARYGLDIDDLTFLPWGYDAYAWVYHVRAVDGARHFLKVRRAAVNEPALLVPRHLHDVGVGRVIAPVPTIAGPLWTEANGYALVLYPYVEGRTGKDGGMSSEQWIEYGATLRRIHSASLPAQVAQRMRRETFVPEGAALVHEIEAHLGSATVVDLQARSLADFWRQRRHEIGLLTARAEDLGRRLAERTPGFVLCHADFHTANVLVATDGQIWIVDWDESVLAPRERDLMFVVGGGISDDLVSLRDEERFLEGYGAVTIDPLALAYYRYAWAVSDIGEYGTQVFLRPDLGETDRHESAERLITLFAPGEIVSKALASALK
jgi:spectinomycin phosphotransferase